MLGIYLQSSIIVTTFFSVLVSITWYFSETVLVGLHQDPRIAKMASTYLRFLIPGLFGFAYLQCLFRFFQTQSIVIPLVVCSVLPLFIHVGLTYLLIHKFSLGFLGAPLATSISVCMSLIMLLIYAKFSQKCNYTWEGLSVESFKFLLPNLKIALPSAIMVCLEYWSFEILVLLAGLMPNSESSTSLIAMCVNTESIAYMITYGFSAAVSTRVSNEIGAGNIKNAKNAVSVTLKLSCFLALTVLLSLAFGHRIWALSFTDSTDIVQQFSYMTPLLSVSILLDSAQGVLSGVARGCGWQHLAAWTNFFAFYMIGMPVALLFGFKFGFFDKACF